MTDNGATTTYCYDGSDQLTSSSDPTVGTPAYDAHGNTTTLGSQALGFDAADRHTSTAVSGGPTVSYVRDGTDRITARTEGPATTRYGYSGPGDSATVVLDAANHVLQRTIPLVGGVVLTKQSSGDVWSYPNVHGDVVATTNAVGIQQGATVSYDPFGQGTPPDNSSGNFDYGWLGQAQRPTEHAGSISTIEMGARPYVPALGRFLSVDPVPGGRRTTTTTARATRSTARTQMGLPTGRRATSVTLSGSPISSEPACPSITAMLRGKPHWGYDYFQPKHGYYPDWIRAALLHGTARRAKGADEIWYFEIYDTRTRDCPCGGKIRERRRFRVVVRYDKVSFGMVTTITGITDSYFQDDWHQY